MNEYRTKQLIEEIQELTRQYHAEVSSTRKPWPASIKSRIQELFDLGMPVKKTATQVDIPYPTIMSWKKPLKRKSSSSFHALTVSPNPTVTVKKSDSQNSCDNLTVTVRTPDGYILEVPELIAVKIITKLRGAQCF